MSDRGPAAMLVDVAAEAVALLDTLTDAEWDAPSLCAEWTIRDVVGHLGSGTSTPLATFTVGMLRARGRSIWPTPMTPAASPDRPQRTDSLLQ